MPETITLDPTAEATGRTELEITPWVKVDGIDWGDAQFEAFMAEAEQGNLPVDGRLPNRVVTIPLTLRTVGATSFSTIRLSLQQKVALFQREGGKLLRQVGSVPLYADVVNASLRLGGGWSQANKDYDLDATLVLECLPDWYGAEIDLGDNTETTNPEIIFTDTGVKGNYFGRVRIVVDDDQGASQRSLLWGFRSRHYSSADTARLAYAGTALDPLDTASSGAGGVTHTNLSTGWTPVLGTNIGGTTYLTHTGSYRVWAGLSGTANLTDVSSRFIWDVGDMTNPVVNDPVTIPPGFGTNYMLDLGEIRLDPSPVGTHRWQGIVQAKGAAGGEDVTVSRLWFQPLDEGAGVLSAPVSLDASVSDFSARDTFDQSAGALAGKTATVGGAWAGAGDADDFSVETTGKTAQRTATSDPSTNSYLGRYAISGASAMTSTVVQADFKASDTSTSGLTQGVVARYADTNNWVGVFFGATSIQFVYRSGGTVNEPADGDVAFTRNASEFYTLRLQVDAAGRWAVWVWPSDQQPTRDPIMYGYVSALATGGGLASGKPGFYDNWPNAAANTRNVDNFQAWVPAVDAVVFASQSLELRTEGAWREDSTGTAYGPVSHVVGSLPRLPVSGLEARTVETFIKASRGDLDQLPDTGTDDISVRVYYRPCWLYVGES